MPDQEPKKNEQWWSRHGRDWYEECQLRRRTIPYYMLHEVFLSGYFGMAAPCKALEFGCGFGRHLHYLRGIPGLELYGCDQSPTMLAGANKLIEQDWLDKHVTLTAPRGELPYADKSFDVVYTASVLIHIQPSDVAAAVKRLLRLARWHILHIENPPAEQTSMTCTEHDGCWAHPLREIYAGLGVELEVLPAYGSLQGVYRAVLDPSRKPPDISSFSRRLWETESFWQGQIDRHQSQLYEHQARIQALTLQMDDLKKMAEELARQLSQRDAQLRQTAASMAGVEQELAAARSEYEKLVGEENRFHEDMSRILERRHAENGNK